MAELQFISMAGGLLRPFDDDVAETVKKWGTGNLINGKFSRPRNYVFLQKFFLMLGVGYDAYDPETIEYKGKPVQKSKERFRADVIIEAGYWHPVMDIRGNVRPEPDSISFAGMDEDEFSVFYNKAQEVLLNRVLRNYTKEDLDNVVAQLMNFL